VTFHSALYRGRLMHARHDDLARRAFAYNVYMAALDLDELPALDRSLRLFSHGRWNLFSFDERAYAATLSPAQREASRRRDAGASAAGGASGRRDAGASAAGGASGRRDAGASAAGGASRGRDAGASAAGGASRGRDAGANALERAEALRDSLAALRAANGLAVPHATRLVTNLAVAGYVFNPVSFFIDYDANGAVVGVIAEVNNTYGGALRYVLGPRERVERGGRVGFRHVRELYVSPFLHGELVYEFWFDAPLDGDALAIDMFVTRAAAPQSRVFTARFAGSRSPLSDRNLAVAAVRYPLMTAQVIGLIHLEALRLRWRGVPYRRPGADHRPLAERP
jgi:hypothetical protein